LNFLSLNYSSFDTLSLNESLREGRVANKVVTAIFDAQVLRPDNPLDLEPNKRYVITIETEQSTATTGDAWDVLEALVGSVETPLYWSIKRDRYLYGTPKHQK
jgi:hypothetical protein